MAGMLPRAWKRQAAHASALEGGVHHPGQQKAVRERQHKSEGRGWEHPAHSCPGFRAIELQENPQPREEETRDLGETERECQIIQKHSRYKMHDPELPTNSISKEMPPSSPFSWLPLFSNVTSREWASLVSHPITAIFLGTL